MAYNVTQLADYVNQESEALIMASLMESKTMKLFATNLQVGVKHSEALQIIDTNPIFQNDAAATSSDAGSTATLTQRIVTVAPVASVLWLDPKVMNTKWTNRKVKPGSSDNEMVFEKEIVEDFVAKINVKNEKALWQGDTSLTDDTTLKHFDGFLKVIDGATGVTRISGASFTSTNALDVIDLVYSSIPTSILNQNDTAIFMGWDYFRIYTQALRKANLFHYDATSNDGELIIPSTQIKLYALAGLNGTKRIETGRISNYFPATDLMNDFEETSVDYVPHLELIKLKIGWKLGVQIARPDELLSMRIAA